MATPYRQVCILGLILWDKEVLLALVPRVCSCVGLGTMAGSREPRAAPHPHGAAAAPPLLFPSHCPEERKDVSSLLPFCLKGMRGGWGGERISLAGSCAIGTITALRSTAQVKGVMRLWPEMLLSSPLLCTVLAVEMCLLPCPCWQLLGSGLSCCEGWGLELHWRRCFCNVDTDLWCSAGLGEMLLPPHPLFPAVG